MPPFLFYLLSLLALLYLAAGIAIDAAALVIVMRGKGGWHAAMATARLGLVWTLLLVAALLWAAWTATECLVSTL